MAVLLIGFSGDLLQWMSGRGWLPGESLKWFNLARWVGAVALIYSSVTLLYNVGHWDRLKWRTATPGAAMTTLLMVLLSVGFSFFIAQLNTYNRLYGSLGTLMLRWFGSTPTAPCCCSGSSWTRALKRRVEKRARSFQALGLEQLPRTRFGNVTP